MQKSGFFNALLTNGEYDRTYNANDYCDNLAVVISNGVLRSGNDDLKVTANGMVVTVGVGRAWINGHYYLNDTPHTFAAIPAPIGGTRYDRVFLRLDKNLAVRSVSLVYQQGTAADNPQKPAPVREGNIYDIVLADIYVGTNATSVSVTDTRADVDLCGWVYSTSGDNSFFTSLDTAFNEWFGGVRDTLASVTLFKRYNWRNVLASATNTVTFNIPQYDAETCFIEVYVNGIVSTQGNDFNLSGSIITFAYNLVAGTEVEIKCFKSIDGTGIMTVADEITALQNAVAALNTTGEYEYICNGVDDNVKLSEIAQAWLNGGTDDKTTVIKVYGNFRANAPFAGTGTEASGFQWLSLGLKETARRKIIFDFSAVEQMYFNCSGNTKNIIFYGADVHIKGAHVKAAGSEANTNVIMFSGRVGEINVEDCDLTISTTGTATIAESGTFTNCNTMITSINNNAAAFAPVTNSRPLVIFGGRHLAYCADNSNYFATVFYTAPTAANAVIMAYGVNLPTVARTSYRQTYGALTDAGEVYISGITTTLGMTKGEHCEVVGHIAINKA
jgi:hypothetical protein